MKSCVMGVLTFEVIIAVFFNDIMNFILYEHMNMSSVSVTLNILALHYQTTLRTQRPSKVYI